MNELPRLTAGEAIAKSLLLHGVDTVFGIPGAHMYHFTDALAREGDRIRFVTTRNEQGAGHLAYGYAKSTGRTGVYTRRSPAPACSTRRPRSASRTAPTRRCCA